MRNARNLLRHELIGLRCEVTDSANQSQKGIRGEVIDEGMKILLVRTAKGDKKIEKKGTKLRFTLDAEKVDIDGNFIIARPEDRIKKKIAKW